MAKRGRKPKTERKGYFYEEQEDAVKAYLNTDDQEERNRIFNTILKPAFTKMVESIIRRYRMYIPEEEFEETFNDTMSFLSSKMANYDPSKHYKAYSYYGTICRNYLRYKRNQFKKKVERNEQYDDLSGYFKNNINYSDTGENNKTLAEELVSEIVTRIRKMLSDTGSCLTEKEERVGLALCELFEHWEDVLPMDESNKLRKGRVLYFLREETMMSTKELRENMKVYKDAYYMMKGGMLND